MRTSVSKPRGAKGKSPNVAAAKANKKHQDDKNKDWYKISTGIRIKRSTRERLKALGKFGEDYDAVINRLLDEYEI